MYASFWGFERAQAVPPNVVLIGPCLKPASDYLKDLEAKDKELFDWMNKAKEDNIPVFYVSIGTECKW